MPKPSSLLNAMVLAMIDAQLHGYALAEVKIMGITRLMATHFTIQHQQRLDSVIPAYIAAFSSRRLHKRAVVTKIDLQYAMQTIKRRKILGYDIKNKYFAEHRKTMDAHSIMIEEIKNTIIEQGLEGRHLWLKTGNGTSRITTNTNIICSWKGEDMPYRSLIISIRAALETVDNNAHLNMVPGGME